ncbi:MAG: glycosyltransferase family 9 protein [Cytophagales bacterium]|nr:glycosyltransferase family 9 protein [Cytophagales bacterium]
MKFNKILIIQTAFIGDVVLATPLIEKLKRFYPDAKVDFLLRKGNENLLEANPNIHILHVWNKKEQKTRNIFRVIGSIRRENYDLLINLQRFGATGLMTFFSGAKLKVGFDKNPFSFCYQRKFKHEIGNGKHEVDRNLELIAEWTDDSREIPKLHLSKDVLEKVQEYKKEPYLTIAPTSVWFTKQYPANKWVEFLRKTDFAGKIYLLGAPSDFDACEYLLKESGRAGVINLSGELSLLESTALMKDARMNYMNDSAPMHFASAVNAPTTAIFCSTIPEFGFGPLSIDSRVLETPEKLDCRPCGLHGFKTCPEGHFRCAENINLN